jgi:hypothetical protein
MKTTLMLTLLSITSVIFLSAAGCGKQTTSDGRAERLAADENYRENKQVAALTKELEQCKQQQAAPAAAEKQQNAALAQENQQLKSSLSAAEANVKTLTDQLEQCQKELASPTDERIKKMAAEVTKAKKDAEDSVNFVMTNIVDESKKEAQQARDEAEKLKTEVQKLQDELKQLKK